jgi:spore coat protein H
MRVDGSVVFRFLLAAFVVAVFAVPCRGAAHRAAEAFFGTTNLWSAELVFSPDQWADLLKGKRTAPRDSVAGQGNESDRNYVYARADFRMEGRSLTNVGVRLKGSGTQSGNGINRWPFRIDLNQFGGKERLDGAGKISLNNNFYDSSYLRDSLSYELFREFGVPAPRTCFIKLHLTVPGQHERKYLGLYTAAEALESPFLKDHFGSASGLLLKPNLGLSGFPPGRDWPSLRDSLGPKTDGTVEQRQQVVDLFRLLNRRDPAVFTEQLPKLIDLDGYLRFLVVNVVLVNQDSYLGMGKNYYIYLDPVVNRLKWLPWDLDLSFGGFFFCGRPEERIDLHINQPSSIFDPLIRQVLAVPAFRERYHELMKEFLRDDFNQAKMFARIDELSGIIRPAVMAEKSMSEGEFERSIDGRVTATGATASRKNQRWMLIEPGLKLFVEKRIESVEAQLAGTRQGVRTGFGPVKPW